MGRRVRQIRLQKNLTQEELGQKVGVSYQQVQKYETGANRISASRLYRIAVEFDVAPGWFFDGIESVEMDLPQNDSHQHSEPAGIARLAVMAPRAPAPAT
ncbi:helix-turn-helix transcriptional regulator [Aureimonas sp. SA4125]|uniref:helix-turn-helix domain-containing protein n=1 Tax=Aureimonas sp. SA4125 TaxID=2826993 RepID=UPI001CC68252|nr:helix-turn-helix transcriptional regulator [Aureimonas sp. SA4125]